MNILWKELDIFNNHAWTPLIAEWIKFLVFLWISLFVKSISLERASIWVCLMITLTFQAFEQVQAWFVLLCFKSGGISLEVCLTILSKMMMMLRFVRSIAFNTFWPLNAACENCISPLLTILILRDTWVHICIFNSSNVTSYVEAPVD